MKDGVWMTSSDSYNLSLRKTIKFCKGKSEETKSDSKRLLKTTAGTWVIYRDDYCHSILVLTSWFQA